jgi:hypothetical protein
MQSLDLPVLQLCLLYLRAKELKHFALSSKWAQSLAENTVEIAIKRYEQADSTGNRFAAFFHAELGALLKAVSTTSTLDSALEAVAPVHYWISSRWIQLWKQWHQSIRISKRSLSKKKTKAQAKRAANITVPSLDMNVDITCLHGGLVPKALKVLRAKRTLIPASNWRLLRQFYNKGCVFLGSCPECEVCCSELTQQKEEAVSAQCIY